MKIVEAVYGCLFCLFFRAPSPFFPRSDGDRSPFRRRQLWRSGAGFNFLSVPLFFYRSLSIFSTVGH